MLERVGRLGRMARAVGLGLVLLSISAGPEENKLPMWRSARENLDRRIADNFAESDAAEVAQTAAMNLRDAGGGGKLLAEADARVKALTDKRLRLMAMDRDLRTEYAEEEARQLGQVFDGEVDVYVEGMQLPGGRAVCASGAVRGFWGVGHASVHSSEQRKGQLLNRSW